MGRGSRWQDYPALKRWASGEAFLNGTPAIASAIYEAEIVARFVCSNVRLLVWGHKCRNVPPRRSSADDFIRVHSKGCRRDPGMAVSILATKVRTAPRDKVIG